MAPLRHPDTLTIQSARVQDAVIETTDLINYEQAVTQAQLEALGRVTAIASFEVARSLAAAEIIRIGRARVMSQQEHAAYEELDTTFLACMGEITRLYNEKIVRLGIPRPRR